MSNVTFCRTCERYNHPDSSLECPVCGEERYLRSFQAELLNFIGELLRQRAAEDRS